MLLTGSLFFHAICWRIHAITNCVSIGSSNDWPSFRNQTITCTKAISLSTGYHYNVVFHVLFSKGATHSLLVPLTLASLALIAGSLALTTPETKGRPMPQTLQDAEDLKRCSGPRLNTNTVFPRYGDSYVKDKTVARPSYLKHGDPYTGETTSLYWDGPLVAWIF